MEFYTWNNYRCAFSKVPGESGKTCAAADPSDWGRTFGGDFGSHLSLSGGGVKRLIILFTMWILLGCGASDMPKRAYRPEDWAEQLACFLSTVATEPVILVVQGALLPVAVRLMALPAAEKVKGLVLSGPPAWRLMTTPTADWKQSLSWSLFASPLGNLFYRYARREKIFCGRFSQRQLFERVEDVTDGWLQMLEDRRKGSR